MYSHVAFPRTQNSLCPGNHIGLLEVGPAPAGRALGQSVPPGPGRPIRQTLPHVRHVSEPSDKDEAFFERLLVVLVLLWSLPLGQGGHRRHRQRDGLVQGAQLAVAAIVFQVKTHVERGGGGYVEGKGGGGMLPGKLPVPMQQVGMTKLEDRSTTNRAFPS